MEEIKKTNLITPAGYKKLSDEAHKLWDEERPRVVDEVTQAAAQGDRSENAEYIYGKRRLREIDKRVAFLERRMAAAKIIEPAKNQSDKIDFGATVDVVDADGKAKTYQIVGEDEAEPTQNKISWKSPVGTALLTKKVGDVVEIETPRGIIELEISGFKFV